MIYYLLLQYKIIQYMHMQDSYQKLADDVFGQINVEHAIFKQVNQEDLDEIRVALSVQISHENCVDNIRVYKVENKKQFYDQADKGCCGSVNSQYKCLSGKIYWIGYNFGH